MKSQIKHVLHCCSYVIAIYISQILMCRAMNEITKTTVVDPWKSYGYVWTTHLYLLRFFPLFGLPHMIMNFVGLVFFNAFPDPVQVKESPISAPFICFRVVTRGDFPNLVARNVSQNMNLCIDVGLVNYTFEVVTDQAVHLSKHERIREIVVPSTYSTKSGALFKSRALQYCIEDHVNKLDDSDWIVHLDEETLLTENSIKGILNFVTDGKHHIGQGMITYGSREIVNWFTTLADCFRVSDDMGVVRCQFKIFRRAIGYAKGSFLVCKADVERVVSFDNGPDGSVSEDLFFFLKASNCGYKFAFIEGEMHEKSPFTFHDMLRQRIRWVQGTYLIAHTKRLPLRVRFYVACQVYYLLALPFFALNGFLILLYPLPAIPVLDMIGSFILATVIYTPIYGALKTFSPVRLGVMKYLLSILGSVVCGIPLNGIAGNISAAACIFQNKYKFYVVQKDF